MQRGGRAYTNNNPYSCNLSNNMSFMALPRVRNRENNEERLTQSEHEKCMSCVSFVSLLYAECFSSGVTDHRPLVSGSGWSDDVLMPGLVTGPWQKPSEPGPGPFLASSNKFFVPVRKWLYLALTILHQIIDGWYFNFRQTFSRAARPFVEHL